MQVRHQTFTAGDGAVRNGTKDNPVQQAFGRFAL